MPILRNLPGALTAALCISSAFVAAPGFAQQPAKPNIILILSDDFGQGDAGVQGGGPGRGMPTPNTARVLVSKETI